MRVIIAATVLIVLASPVGAEEGVATWYGKGKRVACGGPFRPMAMEAAHKTLPCGTRVRVTHHGTGKSVIVVIRDRGPYGRGKIIDLNLGAARVLGIVRSGVARVSVRRI